MTFYEGAWAAIFRMFKPAVHMDGEYGTRLEGELLVACDQVVGSLLAQG